MGKRKVSETVQSGRHYSGYGSAGFWTRIHALPRNEGGETAYVLGCALQDLELRVMTYLENCESKLLLSRKEPRQGRSR